MRWLAELEIPNRRYKQWLDQLRSLGVDLIEQDERVFIRFDELNEIENPSNVNDRIMQELTRLDLVLRVASDVFCPVRYKKLTEDREGRLVGHVISSVL